MAFDRKAWDEANREKNKLYAVRHRLRKKGLDLPPETVAEMEAMRAAKKAESKEKDRQRKKQWAADNRELIRARYREKYHSDPEFRAKEIAKRVGRLPRLTDDEKAARRELRLEARKRERQEKARKARKETNAKRHAEALARAEKIVPRQAPRHTQPKAFTGKVRKPGRIAALSGWLGW